MAVSNTDIRTLELKCTPAVLAAAAVPPPALAFSWQLISQELYVRSDLARYKMKQLDEPDSTVPITLGSSPPLVVKIDIK